MDENTNKNKAIQSSHEEDIKMYRLDISDLKSRLANCEFDKEK
jgi:hypothetical protein